MSRPCSASIDEIADSATTTPESWTDFLGTPEGYPAGLKSPA
jgi:hypothetical protein